MVALEPDGIDTEALARRARAGRCRPKLAHIIPNFQNPAGYTLSRPSATRLLELAVEHDFTIFEDDPYVAIRFEGEPLPTMLSARRDGRVVYASLVLEDRLPGHPRRLPGRPGRAVIKQIQAVATNTYISPNMVAQSIVNQFAARGRMDGAIETVENALRERRDALVAALERELPEARFARPEGGYFMWVELPEAIDVAELEKAAAARERDRSSRARTSCSRAARTRCAWPTRA